MLVILENLHWADPSSLDLFHFVARAAPAHPLVLLATYNDAQRDGNRGLRAAEQSLASLGVAERHLLLPFTADVDFVLGSRTVQTFILSGANMGLFLRWGNWAVAKLTEALFNTVYLSDVGCTFRVVTRSGLERLTPEFEGNGSSFGFEMMLHAARLRVSLVQVPVKYLPRVGESSVTGDRMKTVRLGMSMIVLCLRHRLRRDRS